MKKLPSVMCLSGGGGVKARLGVETACVGASFGKRGGGRTGLLVLDWVLGMGHGAVALVTPRAHLRNLLGGAGPMEWSGRASAAALVVLAVVCALLAVRRSSRTA